MVLRLPLFTAKPSGNPPPRTGDGFEVVYYCQTSGHDGRSNAIKEALAAGRPCVVTKGYNFDEIEDGNAGLVVPPCPKSMAKAVE